ncbi:hypothetical protein TNCV_3670591 [Trichonephila clavipes]|nr:hypothetical protein TNCV_3670591 [Trichonephila clavipes]
MNALQYLRLNGMREILRRCVNVFVKMVDKHLRKMPHTSRRRRLSESFRCKRLQFWQRDDWNILHKNAPAHRSQLVKEFLAETRLDVLPHSLPQFIRTNPVLLLSVPINEKAFTGTLFCVIR